MSATSSMQKHMLIIDGYNMLDGFSNLLAYGDSTNAHEISVGQLADVIAGKEKGDVEFTAISVHIGTSNPKLHPVRHAAEMKRIRRWERDSRVKVHDRRNSFNEFTGRYEEKGVDTAMALELCMTQATGTYDKITVFSADADMQPALEHAYNAFGTKVGLARWVGQPSRLGLPGKKLWCHYLDEIDLARCSTRRNNRDVA